jgi:hypothetical protein
MTKLFTLILFAFPFSLFAQYQVILNSGDTATVTNIIEEGNFYTLEKADGRTSRLTKDLVRAVIRDYKDATEVYCLIVGQAKFMSTEVTVSIDYGQERSFWKRDKLEDEQGNTRTFNSMIDALNYMNSEGWGFVDAYAVTIGQQNVYHWLLKRDR